MPSKESLEHVECSYELFRRDGAHYCHLPREHEGDHEYFYTRKQLHEAIREARVAEAEWWFNQYCPTEDPKAYQRIAQLREGKS
jgi:hypothetical protein